VGLWLAAVGKEMSVGGKYPKAKESGDGEAGGEGKACLAAGWREKSKPVGGCLVCLWQREGAGREVVCREDEVVAGSLWPTASGDG